MSVENDTEAVKDTAIWAAQTNVLIDNYNMLTNRLFESKNILNDFATNDNLTNSFVIIELLNLYLLEFLTIDDSCLVLDVAYIRALFENSSTSHPTRINIFYLQSNWVMIATHSFYADKIKRFYSVINQIEAAELKVFLCRILIFYKRIIRTGSGDFIDVNYRDETCIRAEPHSTATVEKIVQVPIQPPPPLSLPLDHKKMTKRTSILKPPKRTAKQHRGLKKSVTWNNREIDGQRMNKYLDRLRGNM